ncbi:IclR-family transcriptional regulator [Streptomyces hygroscopicus subsp. jinggangensis 5008]|nr:IclR-family transcriptional regulator [Streptomyces hygroscopicus subsp. jinggangensis 5008]
MIRLGSAYSEVAALPTLAQPIVTAARDEIGEAVSVAVLEGAESLIIARAEVQRIVNTGVWLGARLPATASASGRVLLAGLSDDAIDSVLESGHPVRTTPHTLVTASGIRDRTYLARTEEVSYTNEELELGVRSMTVPVIDSAGRVRAAMTTSSFAARASIDEMRRRFPPLLRKHAAALGRSL